MRTLGITHSVCETCLALVPAKVIERDGHVYFEKFCPSHGRRVGGVRADVDDYLRTLSFVRPAWIPREFAGDPAAPCPEGCGFCNRHEQHLCMPLVEITSRCDLACPICLVDAGQPWDMSTEELRRILDGLIAAERQIDVLNFSGGEPLLHPRLLEMVDTALARQEIVRVSISTNGLALLDNPALLDALQQRNVVISLQFDGFNDDAYVFFRGRPLLDEKTRLLETLESRDMAASLVMTVAAGVNDDQLPAVVQHLLTHPNTVSLMIQPLAMAGRARNLPGNIARITIPEIVGLLDRAWLVPTVADDFSPLPCCHPLCFSQAFYLVLDGGGIVSFAGLLDNSRRLDAVANRTLFGLDAEDQDRIKDMIYDIWSNAADAQDAPEDHHPDGPGICSCMSEKIMATMRALLDEMAAERFDPRRAFALSERRVKSIFIHAFQDAETFDLARVRRCCNAYPQPDGRLIPACVHNVLGRNGAGAKRNRLPHATPSNPDGDRNVSPAE